MATRETLKTRVARAGEELRETGRLVLRAPVLVRVAECAMRFLLGGMLSGATIFGGNAPFGLALVGASGSGLDGFCALLGACFGAMAFQGFVEGLRYVAAAILVFSVSFAFFDVRLYQKAWFMPVVAALLNGATGFVYLTEQGWRLEDTLYFATELLLTGAAVYFYRIAFSHWRSKREEGDLTVHQTVSLLILGGTLLIALANIYLFDVISVGRLVAAVGVMLAGYKGGLGLGAAVGISAGLAMDLAAGGVPCYSMAYAFAGLMTGAFQKQGKLFSALSYVLANAVALLWTWQQGGGISSLYEVFMASVLFLLLPPQVFRRVGALTAGEPNRDTAAHARAYVKERLSATAEAFRMLQASMGRAFAPTPPNDGDLATIFDRAAERTCQKCALQNLCWQRDYVTTYHALNDALPMMQERGKGLPGDFPTQFSSRCLRFPTFLSAANEELTALLYRRQYHSRLRESRGEVCRQYGALSEILGAAAAELSAELTVDPVREKRLRQHMAAQGLEGTAAVYYDEAGHLRAELEGPELEALAEDEALARLSAAVGLPLRQVQMERTRGGDRLVLAQAEPLMALAGVAAQKKEGEQVSGDAGAWFKGEDGVLYVLLCDGMGSGPEASQESKLAVRLLEQFLRAGVQTQVALKTISAALGLRNEEAGGFTTIDLLRVDLFTGEAEIYKYGAAPTYVKQGDKVRRVTGTALPAGLGVDGASPDVARLRLAAGDCVLLASDGIADAEEDGWLREKLEGFDGTSPKDLARAILEGRGSGADDRTALVLKIQKR